MFFPPYLRPVVLLLGAAMFLPLGGNDISRAQSAVASTSPEAIEARIARQYPRHATGTLRYQGISDEEVREIQQEVARILPGTLVYISSVFNGCGCEEATGCTNEVRVVAYRPPQNTALTLIRSSGKWQLGALQKWQLRYAAVEAKYRKGRLATDSSAMTARRAYVEELQTLLAEMPVCQAPTRPSY